MMWRVWLPRRGGSSRQCTVDSSLRLDRFRTDDHYLIASEKELIRENLLPNLRGRTGYGSPRRLEWRASAMKFLRLSGSIPSKLFGDEFEYGEELVMISFGYQ